MIGLGTLLTGLPLVGNIIGMFTGDRVQREVQEHEDVLATKQHLANEMSYAATNRTRFDAFVDGISRLPRPLLAFSVFGFFWWAMADPHGFTVRMQALQFVPEMLWVMLMSIIGLYFPIRSFEKLKLKGFVPPRIAPEDFISKHYPKADKVPEPEEDRGPTQLGHELGHSGAAGKGSEIVFERPTVPPELRHPNPTLTAWRRKIRTETG